VIAAWAGLSNFAHADDPHSYVFPRPGNKAISKWSLDEFIAQQNKFKLQDLWLAFHTPTPFEFFLSGAYKGYATPNISGSEFALGAFASLFGIGIQDEAASDNRLYGLFYLRIFGFQDEGTNLTLQTGLRNVNAGSGYRNALAGGSLSIYIKRYFAITGLYRHYFSSTPTESGAVSSGDRFEGGALVDFKLLQIYGNYFAEQENATASIRNGVTFGGRFYF